MIDKKFFHHLKMEFFPSFFDEICQEKTINEK